MFQVCQSTRQHLASAVLLAVGLFVAGTPARAADLLNDTIDFSGGVLHLKSVADLGSDNLISITSRPDSAMLYVTTQAGQVFEVDSAGNASAWFDYNALVNAAMPGGSAGYVLTTADNNHGGLRSVAFHPEFASNGKFYTSAALTRPADTGAVNYLGTSGTSLESDSGVVEWEYDFASGQVLADSYRELFRVQMPYYDHPIKQMAFNHFAEPGDEDYGLLYIAHGDASVQSAIAGGGANTADALGKVLRINPLQAGGSAYTTPGNPFNDTPGTLAEIYTLGHRNPHHLSFALDEQGNSRVIVAEIGRDNIEEINILRSGGDYGWSDREGTFVHLTDGAGYISGVTALPANDWELNDYIYPVAQYDHDTEVGAGYVGSAVAGGFVLDHADYAALDNQYLFADFGTASGFVYHADWSQMLAAHTQLADGEAPSALSQAAIQRLLITLDLNGDGRPDRSAQDLNTLLDVARSDVRFGRGPDGRMYLTSKTTGQLYVVTGAQGAFGNAAGQGLRLDERFTYADGELAGNASPESGWSGRWVGAHAVQDGEFSTTEHGLSSRPFIGHEPGQTLYFSVELMASEDADGKYTAWLQIDDNAYDQSHDGVQVGLDDGVYALRINGPANRADFGAYTPGERVLIIGKLEFDVDGVNERLTSWINPTGNESAQMSHVITADLGFTLAQSVEIGVYDFDGAQVLFDNIRLGATWADVAASAIIPGDSDGDGDLDDADLGTTFANYTGPVGASAGKAQVDGDSNGDGDIDDADLGAAFANYTGPTAPPSNVPEPASFLLLAAGSFALARRRAG